MFKKNVDLFKLFAFTVVVGCIAVISVQQKKIISIKEDIQKSNSVLENKLDSLQKTLDTLDERSNDNKEQLDSLDSEVKDVLDKIEKIDKKNIELEKKVSSKELARKNSLLASKVEVKPTVKSKETVSSSNKTDTTPSGKAIVMSLSFYGELSGICADGSKISHGAIASNVYPLGTKFLINGIVYTVRDKGGPHFNSYNRLDVFIPRLAGESNSEYKQRLMKLGRQTVTAYKIN